MRRQKMSASPYRIIIEGIFQVSYNKRINLVKPKAIK